jgi:glucose dehydrogenase
VKINIMKRKNKLIMSGLMALVLGLGISGSALAYQGDFSKNGPNYTPDFEAQITEVMVNKDYEGWKDLIEEKVGKGKVTSTINKDNFSKFTEAWKLAKEGKIKEANVIRKELGLRTNDGIDSINKRKHGMGRGNGFGKSNGMGRGHAYGLNENK